MINISTPPEIVISDGLLQIFGDEPVCYDLLTPTGITVLRFLASDFPHNHHSIPFCDGRYRMRFSYRKGYYCLRGYANGKLRERYICAASRIGELTYHDLLKRARTVH